MGRFHWPDIPAGIYELRASKGPLVAPPVEGLILDAGARRAFGIQLGRGWALAGQVLDAQTGRLIEGAQVTLATGALGLHTRSASTTERGQFELGGVVGSEQSLYVEAEGYVAAGPLVHREGEPPIVVRLERGSSISGRVVDDRGQPIRGAVVRAFGEGQVRAGTARAGDSLGTTSGPVPPISAAGTGALGFVEQVVTGADGRFRLDHLRSGPYTVAASHEEYAAAESKHLRLGPGSAQAGVEIRMRSGAELAGEVVDERGRGLEGIPVELRTEGERLPRMTVTASDGSFSFRGVRGELSVTALPYDLPAVRQRVTVEDEALVTVELELSSSLYTLHGRVVDERGFGVSGALLTVRSKNPETPVSRSAKSDADGSFSVPALPEPPFELRAEHPAFSSVRLPELDSVDDVQVEMSAGITFLGEVLDAWTSEGLANVRVQVSGPMDSKTRTRADGSYVFRQAPTGTYEVSFSHTDYESQSRRVVLEPPRFVDRPQELETVRLDPGGTVEGEVLDTNSEPVANAEVTWGEPPQWDHAALSDGRGRFLLRGVPEGSHWLSARHAVAGEASSLEAVLVRPLETTPGAFIRLPDSASE